MLTIFKLWQSNIWNDIYTIRFKIWRNFNAFLSCILTFMLNFEILFWRKYKTMSRTIEYKCNSFIQYFVDPPLALITLKIRLGLLSTNFWSWTEGIFPMSLRLPFRVQKLLSTIDLLHNLLQQSISTNFL